MDDLRWSQLVRDIEADDIERTVEACEALQKEAEESDVPRLLALLQNDNFVVREAAAWPLTVLSGPAVLDDLFDAYQRGFDEGLDNDSFTAALVELVNLNKTESCKSLLRLRESSIPHIRKYSEWLLEFC